MRFMIKKITYSVFLFTSLLEHMELFLTRPEAACDLDDEDDDGEEGENTS